VFKRTYIRVLADDIGKLGCGAPECACPHGDGPFRLAQALTLPALEEAAPRRLAAPRDYAIGGGGRLPGALSSRGCCHQAGHGIAPTPRGIARHVGTFAAADTVALFGPDKAVLAMGSVTCGAAELEDMPRSAPVVRLRRVLS
jgi:hypothetical protein